MWCRNTLTPPLPPSSTNSYYLLTIFFIWEREKERERDFYSSYTQQFWKFDLYLLIEVTTQTQGTFYPFIVTFTFAEVTSQQPEAAVPSSACGFEYLVKLKRQNNYSWVVSEKLESVVFPSWHWRRLPKVFRNLILRRTTSRLSVMTLGFWFLFLFVKSIWVMLMLTVHHVNYLWPCKQ